MVNKIIIFLALASLSISCAITSQNTSANGEFVITGGTSGNKIWNEGLVFKKKSWYKQTTLVYEVMLAEITKDSPFYAWFSTSEKSNLLSCKRPYILLDYTFDASILPRSLVREQLHAKGFKEVSVNGFSRELKNHPQYKISNLLYYKIKGYCLSSEKSEALNLYLPGFQKSN